MSAAYLKGHLHAIERKLMDITCKNKSDSVSLKEFLVRLLQPGKQLVASAELANTCRRTDDKILVEVYRLPSLFIGSCGWEYFV